MSEFLLRFSPFVILLFIYKGFGLIESMELFFFLSDFIDLCCLITIALFECFLSSSFGFLLDFQPHDSFPLVLLLD